jgi:two-component system nitrogen regulation response regulator GlnG
VEHVAARAEGRSASRISPAFLEACASRHWPGNVRQLKRAVEYALVVSRGSQLRPEHLPAATVSAAELTQSGLSLEEAVRHWAVTNLAALGDAADGQLHSDLTEQVERALFAEALAATDSNRTAAARLLGLDRATLRTRLKNLGID